MMRTLAIGAIFAAALGVPAVGSAWGQTEPAWIVGPPGTMTLDGTDIRIVYRIKTRDFQLLDGPVVVETPSISLKYSKVIAPDIAGPLIVKTPSTSLEYLKYIAESIADSRREIGLLPK